MTVSKISLHVLGSVNPVECIGDKALLIFAAIFYDETVYGVRSSRLWPIR